MPRKKKPVETPEERIHRLVSELFDAREEIATLKAKMSLFKPGEWSAREDSSKWDASRKQAQATMANAGQEWAEKNEYPNLTGTSKQITWALTLRKKLVEKLRTEVPEPRSLELEKELRTQEDAVWWIDHRPTHHMEMAFENLFPEEFIDDEDGVPIATKPIEATTNSRKIMQSS